MCTHLLAFRLVAGFNIIFIPYLVLLRGALALLGGSLAPRGGAKVLLGGALVVPQGIPRDAKDRRSGNRLLRE